MRLITFFSLFLLITGCSYTKNISKKTNELNGTWVPVKQEMAGTQLPPVVFDKQKLIISDSTYIFTAESVDKGEVKVSNGKMDIYGKEGVNAGKHFTAIYKYENGELTICYNLAGNSYPDTFDTKGNPLFFLSVFKKEATK